MSLNQALETLHRRLSRRWREAPAGAEGLSLNEFQFLRAVETIRGQCPAGPKGASSRSPHLTDLARELGTKRPSASAMSRKLEQRGLVTRVDCRGDARAQHVVLTGSGSAALKQSAVLSARSARTLIGRVSAREAKALRKLLEKVCEDA